LSLTLTAAEAAKVLKISKYTFYELVKRGEIPAHHIGRQLRIDPTVLDNYLRGTLSLNPPLLLYPPILQAYLLFASSEVMTRSSSCFLSFSNMLQYPSMLQFPSKEAWMA